MSGILQAFAYGRAFTSAPVNTVAPAVTGTATFGQTLSCSTGTWTGIPTPTYTYQWQRVTTNISGATSSTYVLVQADVGSTIRCVVTATNSTSAVSANSNSTATVAATVPGAPTIGTATASGSTGATVSYTAPASNGGSNITTYTATSLPGGITGTLSTSGSGTITVSGLTTGTAYTFTVTATNAIGTSSSSAASNSITPVASGFLATESYTGATSIQARAVGVNSSGLIFKVPYAGGYGSTGTGTVIQYSTTGSVNFKNYGYIDNQIFEITVDASNNYYVVGQNSANKIQVTKYNSSNTLQWSTIWDGNVSGIEQIARPFIDSSGNVYIMYLLYQLQCCCNPTTYYIYSVKINSSGVLQIRYEPASGLDYEGYVAGMGVDSSGNVYNALQYSGSRVAIYKSNSSNVIVDKKAYKFTDSTQIFPAAYVFDVANSAGYVVGYAGAGGVIMKHDTSLGVTWCFAFSNTTSFRGAALDSSGNVYAVGWKYVPGDAGYTVIVKVNSSGTIQWARQLSYSSPWYDVSSSMFVKIQVAGSKFTVSNQIFNGNNFKPYTFSAPTDGSGTATISNAGITWTYAASSISATSNAVTAITASSFYTAPISYTTATPSLNTSSSWSASTTQF